MSAIIYRQLRAFLPLFADMKAKRTTLTSNAFHKLTLNLIP